MVLLTMGMNHSDVGDAHIFMLSKALPTLFLERNWLLRNFTFVIMLEI